MQWLYKKMPVILPAVLILVAYLYVSWPHLVVAVSSLQPRSSMQYQSMHSNATQQPQMFAGQPSRISIPNLGMILDVETGEYDSITHTWRLDNSHAFFMKEAATPLIYGHATEPVFEKLARVEKGDVLKVMVSGKTYVFQYVQDKYYAPDDVSVLQRKLPQTVFLMTCSGAWFEQRRVLEFALVEAA